jgi:hypothetical protein
MSEALQKELRGFATELIERNGGLVDWPADSDCGQAMLTPAFAHRQGVDDMLQLCSRPEGGGMFVSLASDFLDAAEHWLAAVPRLGAVQLTEAYLKRGDLGDAVARSFTWLNAKVRIGAGEPTRIDYHTWWFHVLLASEDRWETQLAATINAQTAVEVDFPVPLQLWELQPFSGDVDADASYSAAVTAVERRIPSLAEGFLARMDARLERDRKRLTDYYNALRREANQKRQRARTAVAPEQADAADRAVTLELRRMLAELEERYAIDATVRPLIMVQTKLPVLMVPLAVHRKQSVRQHAIYWNPLTKAFEPIRCTACGREAYSLAFTNEHVDALCAICAR